ncbi:MAG: carbamoyl-phosphate synthase small subunit [Gammaproteobacteria bacterium]|jgi:carbamoyl-phosphate synthase small subunit
MSVRTPALLALEDGTVLHGRAVGACGQAVGEVVFNTAMSGYQEILTDPSYCRQIVTLTYPHIGNVGVNREDEEADSIHASGLVIRDLPRMRSNFRSEEGLEAYLQRRGVIALCDVDTRQLTRILREKGALRGCIAAGDNLQRDEAVAMARQFPGLQGMDLAKVVSTVQAYEWREGIWQLPVGEQANCPGAGYALLGDASLPYRVVAYDFGVKRNILRLLTQHGCRVLVVPAQTPASAVLAHAPDGVFLANGPGDPEPCSYAITAIGELLEAGLPLFGICLGHQLLGLAGGARTQKMKFGHHGANHPVQELATGRVLITSQNHGFAVDEQTLPSNMRATHRSLFDGSLQGIEWTDRPAFGFQGHPEASPGPHDVTELFDRFIKMMQARTP